MKQLKENDKSVRTVSGFQEFTKNGKSSLCEDSTKNIKVFLRKKRK